MPTYRSVFISHAHVDNAICKQYADALRAKGIDVWIDLTNAQRGQDLGEEIASELRARSAFILMVTADSNASHWVRQEAGIYNHLRNTQATHYVDGVERMILPVRLNAEVPTLFSNIYWVDAHNQPVAPMVERIAAALVIGVQPPPPPPPAHDWEEIGIHGQLYELGFRGWRVRTTGVEFILPPTSDVAAGSFLMGSADSDKQATSDEKPQYRIPVGAFAIGKFLVTVAEYTLYLKANPSVELPPTYTYPKDVPWAPKKFWGTSLTWAMQRQKRQDHPVVCVSWLNVRDYVSWLAKTTGMPFRLPTEAEWEKAARWDATRQVSRIYPWGDRFDNTHANTGLNGTGPGLGHTTPVGSYPTGKSPYGAQDMAGNVWEWCSSLNMSQYPYDPAVAEILDNRTDAARSLRGGSWLHIPRYARAAYRYLGSYPDVVDGDRGFRVGLGSGAGAS